MRYGVLIAAVSVAAVAAIVVMRMSAGGNAQQPVQPQALEQQTVNVYVASKPITLGTSVTEDMIASQPWPAHLALEGFVMADGKTNVIGMVARAPFQQNEPLILSKLANPNDPNFMAGDLPAGMRMVTIPVNETDGVAGFIFPGDHVDVMYTHDVDKWEYPPSAGGNASGLTSAPTKTKQTVTETLLTNVKVMAIDQRATSAGATNDKGALIIPRSASLMVSQADAQRVRLSQKTGTLSLALRALKDKESADPLILTSPTDVSISKTEDASPSSDAGIKIVRGAPSTNKETEAGAALNRGASGSSGFMMPPMQSPNVVNPATMAIP